MKSKKKIRTERKIQLQFHTITMLNGRIQYERKAAGKLILKHICMKTVNSYYKKKNALSAFLKETEEDELTISVLK